ncbi:hypothetical protein NC652_039293 [Populus alba x Populus x berolinensis]|nr:hypothetical protein NC652_039293 [Populus alba x Populus x berolinensis]
MVWEIKNVRLGQLPNQQNKSSLSTPRSFRLEEKELGHPGCGCCHLRLYAVYWALGLLEMIHILTEKIHDILKEMEKRMKGRALKMSLEVARAFEDGGKLIRFSLSKTREFVGIVMSLSKLPLSSKESSGVRATAAGED